MADRGKAARFQAIIQNLVEEAERNNPAFSEALHARVCEAVRRKAAAAAAPSPAGLARRRPAADWVLLGAAVAAMLLVAVALGLTWHGLGGFGPAEPFDRGGAPIAHGGNGAVRPEQPSASPDRAVAAPGGALAARSTQPQQPDQPELETPDGPTVASAHTPERPEGHQLAEDEAPTVPEIASLVGGGLAQSQWAYLAYDLRLGADLLADQFPFELAESDEP